MANLPWSELKKREGRVTIFTDKFANGEPFVLTDGTARVITKVTIGTGGSAVDYLPRQSDTLNTVLEGAPKTPALKVTLVTQGNGKITLGKLEKTPEFGGAGTVNLTQNVQFGGVKTEVLSEVGFSFYYAMQVNGHLGRNSGYNPIVWQGITNNREFAALCRRPGYSGTSRMLSYQFKDQKNVDNHIGDMYAFLTQEGWDQVLRRQVAKFQSEYGISNQYFISRGDGLPAYFNPYEMWRTIRKSMKETHGLGGQVVGEDKWNPADVWVMNAAGINHLKALKRRANKLANIGDDQYTVGLMNTVNKHLLKWYRQKSVIPISLKKSGASVNIKEINMGTSDVEQHVQYVGTKLSSSNQDVQIEFDVITVRAGSNRRVGNPQELRMKMKTRAGGWRLEIEERRSGATARHGSIGVGLQQFIIYGTARGGIQQLQRIRSEEEFDNIRQFFPSGGQNWMGILEYRSVNPSSVLLPYVNRLMQEINSSPSDQRLTERVAAMADGPINKAGAGELAVAIDKIANRIARDVTVENLYSAAGSSGVKAGITQNQLRARQQALGLTNDDLISVGDNIQAAVTVFNGGPHIKIS